MKRFYTLVAMLAVSGSALAQLNLDRHATKSAQTTPAVHAQAPQDAGNRTVFWSEDFASGIPATWSNVTVTGPVDWKYTTVGHTGDFPTAAINSTTNGNGWIIVDSDGDNFSGGGAEDSQLTTDVIDLSGSGATDYKLEFEQMFREWQADITTIRVTVDGGANWTDYIINDGVGQSGTPNPDVVTLNITNAVTANPANVQIMFWWQGSWDYGWQVDDISISDIPDNDLKVRNPVFGNGLEYYQSKLNQVQPNTFSADVTNQGLLDQTNVVLDVDVSDGSSSVFSGTSSAVATQTPGQTDSLAVATWTASSVGSYDATYTANQDETEDEPSNNSITKSFQVTDCIMARDNNIVDGRLGNSDVAYEYGAIYEITTDDEITQIDVYIRSDTTTPGALIYGVVYMDDAGTFNYLDQTADYEITANDLDNWVTLELTNPIPVTAGSSYVVCSGFYGGADEAWIGRGSNASPDQSCFILDGNDNTWYFTNRTPMVRAGLGNACPVGIEEVAENGITLGQNIPNPFEGTTTINYELTEAMNITLEVIDVTGKVVMEVNEGTVSAGAHNIVLDADGLDAGVYFYSIVSNNSRLTKQMVITK